MRRGGQRAEKYSVSGVKRGDEVYNEETNPGGATFNKCVNPGNDAEWNEAVCVHGLTAGGGRGAREGGVGGCYGKLQQKCCLFHVENRKPNFSTPSDSL